jgi:hypothetical protein
MGDDVGVGEGVERKVGAGEGNGEVGVGEGSVDGEVIVGVALG